MIEDYIGKYFKFSNKWGDYYIHCKDFNTVIMTGEMVRDIKPEYKRGLMKSEYLENAIVYMDNKATSSMVEISKEEYDSIKGKIVI